MYVLHTEKQHQASRINCWRRLLWFATLSLLGWKLKSYLSKPAWTVMLQKQTTQNNWKTHQTFTNTSKQECQYFGQGANRKNSGIDWTNPERQQATESPLAKGTVHEPYYPLAKRQLGMPDCGFAKRPCFINEQKQTKKTHQRCTSAQSAEQSVMEI